MAKFGVTVARTVVERRTYVQVARVVVEAATDEQARRAVDSALPGLELEYKYTGAPRGVATEELVPPRAAWAVPLPDEDKADLVAGEEEG